MLLNYDEDTIFFHPHLEIRNKPLPTVSIIIYKQAHKCKYKCAKYDS